MKTPQQYIARLSQLFATRKLIIALSIVAVVGTTTAAIAFGASAAPAGKIVGVPAKDCQSADESWVGPINARGRPQVASKADPAQFNHTNAAVWQGGSGMLQCGGFSPPDDRMARLALSFSIAAVPAVAPGTASASAIDNVDGTAFEVAQRSVLAEPAAGTQTSLDSLLRILVSQDHGQTWEQLQVMDTAAIARAGTEGYFSVKLPSGMVADVENLLVKLEGLQAGEVRQNILVDSVFLSYEVAPPRHFWLEVRNAPNEAAGKPVFRRDQPVTFRLQENTDQNVAGTIVTKVGRMLGVAPEPEVILSTAVTKPDGQPAANIAATTSWKENAWEVDLPEPASLDPGAYTLSVKTLDKEGNEQVLTQDFLWGVLALNTHKSMYQPNETVDFDMAVLDERGSMVCDANVTLEISGPAAATLSTANGGIKVSDECRKLAVTKAPDYAASFKIPQQLFGQHNGKYTLTLTAETRTGKYTISDSFEVGGAAPAVVTRSSHTRIMPKFTYNMSFEVTPAQDFMGTIVETVPKDFSIANYGAVIQANDGKETMLAPQSEIADGPPGSKQLKWHVELRRGHTYRFSYDYDAPDVSPEFYLLGPLAMQGDFTFTEPRSWQVASDAVGLQVQRGQTQILSGGTTRDVTITAVSNTNRAFIMHTYRGDDGLTAQNLQEIFATATFTNTSTVRFQRATTTGDNNIPWYVVEATNEEFEVTHGSVSFSSAQTSVAATIADIGSTTNAIVLVDGYANVDNAAQQLFSGKLNSTTQVQITRGASGTAATARFQVIKWSSDVAVQKGTATMTAAATATASISAVDLSRTALFMTRSCGTNGIAQVTPRGWFSSTTQVSFERSTSTGNCTIEWAAVQFPTGVDVQADNNASPPTDNSLGTTVTLSAVTLANSFSMASNQTSGTGTAFPRGITTNFLSDSTTLELFTSYSGQTSEWNYYAIDTSGWPLPVPDAPTFYNTDGTNQIAFDNIRQNSTTPTFRVSSTYDTSFNRFQLELNTAVDFTGTSYTQTFTGTYASGTQYNLTANSLSPSLPTTNNAAYYVRARASADGGTLWSDWAPLATQIGGGTSFEGFEGGSIPAGYTVGGNASPFVQSTTKHSGTYALQYGNINDNGLSWIEWTAPSAGTISFWRMVDSEINFDFLQYRINGGSPQGLISGATVWVQTSGVALNQGDVIRWEYAKDVSESSVADTGWLDDITFEGTSGGGEAAGWSYTYKTSGDPDWYQSTNEQFNTGTLSGVETTGGTVQVPSGTGTIMSSPINFDRVPGSGSWNQFTWSETQTTGTVSAKLYYTNIFTCDTVIPNTALSGNQTGFASGPVNISGLNTTTYDEICIEATLTNSGGSPSLNDWSVSWAAANSAPSTPTSLAQSKTNDTSLAAAAWTNENSIKLSATVTDADAGDALRICAEVKPLGTPFTSSSGDGDGCSTGTVTSGNTATVTIGGLSDGQSYHWQIKAKDATGAYSSWTSFGGGVTRDFGVDTSAPTGGNVYDGTAVGVDAKFNNGSLSALSANWANFNFNASGINRYEYSIGTTPGGTSVVNWTNNGTTTSVTHSGLSLRTSAIYYFNIRAVDNAGNTAAVSSDGQFVLPELSFSVSPSSINFGNLNVGNDFNNTGNTLLTTSTNAYGGYVVRAHAADLLKTGDGAFSIPWFNGGTYASPAVWGSSTGYGYTSSDSTIQGVNKFGGGTLYAPFSVSSPGDIIADHTTNVSGTPVTDETFTITHQVTTSNTQAAGAYNTTIIYTVTPQY